METQFPVLCSSKPLKPELEKFQRIPITSDVFKLGRGHRNTVVMPSKCLSKDHCIFKKVEDDWIIENCSYSRIKVNGNKLRRGQKRRLHDQDIIKLEPSNEFVYMFNKNSTVRKRRKLDGNNENAKENKKILEKPTASNKNEDKTQVKDSEQKDQIMLEVSRKEKQIYNDYAIHIEKLKGSKKMVKRHKALLKVKRDAELASVRVEMAGKMASLTKLKELEKQKSIRENELQEELNKLNKKLAEQIELHESEKRRAEQLLNQQKEQKVEPTPVDAKVDMESELQCSICSELFIRATTLGCSHSFCQYCIRKWHSNRRECPICRAPIKSECRSIVLDSLVQKMTETSEEAKKKRQETVKAREELEARDATTAESSRVSDDYDISPDYYDYDNSESNSSYYGRESSLEPDPELLVMEDDDDYELGGESSDASMSDQLEDDVPDPDNSESSPELMDSDYEDRDNSAPENYDDEPENSSRETDECDNSAPENYDEGENSAPENSEGENSAPENYEGENSALENSDPEYEEHDNSAPEDNHDNYEDSSDNDHQVNVGDYEGESLPDNDYDAYEGHSRESDDGEHSPREDDDGDSQNSDDDYY